MKGAAVLLRASILKHSQPVMCDLFFPGAQLLPCTGGGGGGASVPPHPQFPNTLFFSSPSAPGIISALAVRTQHNNNKKTPLLACIHSMRLINVSASLITVVPPLSSPLPPRACCSQSNQETVNRQHPLSCVWVDW